MSDIIHSLEKVQLHNELAQARQQIEEWKTWGIAEIAIRNPNVSSYMDHWEKRAEAAEQQLAAAQAALLKSQDVLREFLSIRSWTIEAGGTEGPLSQDVIRQFAELQQHAIDGAEACQAEQPTDALRAFVLGLLPDEQEEGFYKASVFKGQEHNKLVKQIRANLERALGGKP